VLLRMLALHDTEQAGDRNAPSATSTRGTKTTTDIEKEYAQRCKTLSHEIYSSIEKLATELESGNPCCVSVDTARGWLASLRELNICISQYARASVARVDRLQVEAALAHNAMASDLLDREACHTTTLEAIASAQLPCYRPDESSQPSSSSDSRPGDSVDRAMQLVMQTHSNTAPFTSEGTHGYFGAPRCLFPPRG
jgi:hypothetical protein